MDHSVNLQQDILDNARKIFVDFKSVNERELIKYYELIKDVFKYSYLYYSEDDCVKLVITQIQKAMNSLKLRERETLWLYYGFNAGNKNSLNEIAKKMGISANRVGQMRINALQEIAYYKEQSIIAVNLIRTLENKVIIYEEQIAMLKEKLKTLKGTPIETINWSRTRTYNLLKRNGIETVDQFLALTAEEMSHWLGAGTVVIDEIIGKQAEIRNNMK